MKKLDWVFVLVILAFVALAIAALPSDPAEPQNVAAPEGSGIVKRVEIEAWKFYDSTYGSIERRMERRDELQSNDPFYYTNLKGCMASRCAPFCPEACKDLYPEIWDPKIFGSPTPAPGK